MSMILFRTHKFDAEARAFCELLDATSGMPVTCLVDETRGPLDTSPYPKVSLTRAALRGRGLPAAADAAWRCGDYGLYLALDAHPEVERFWLVEYDVRVRTAQPLAGFFSRFDRSPADLLAPFLKERGPDWWWTPAMQAGDAAVWGCLFSLLRVSAPLLRTALQARRRHARQPLYRLFWPNDESFLATTAVRNGFAVEDINAAHTWYTDGTFSFERPWSGAELAQAAPDGLIYHPVLYGDELARKRNRLAKPSTYEERIRRKLRRMLRGLA